MIVWAGCLTCRHDERAKKWEGFWVEEEAFPALTVYDVHQPGHLPDIDDHIIHAYTLDDFGVPREQSENKLRAVASYAAALDEDDLLAPMAMYAIATGKGVWDVDYEEFRRRYYGQWYGKPTRAARKRYVFLTAGPGVWYVFRRTI